MKKYLRLVCDTCKRSTDKLLDLTRFTPDQCTITLKCSGRLFPLEQRSSGAITPAPRTGVVDWRPRGTIPTGTVAAKELTFINTATGSKNQLVIAASPTQLDSLAGRGPAPTTLTLTLNVRDDKPKAYRQYVFRVEGSFDSVNGVESGLEKKTLRFAQNEVVEVYLNGIKLERGSEASGFSIYDGSGSSAVPPNTISFNETISLPGITQVDVVVSAVATTTTVTLELTRNIDDESRRSLGAWENVDTVSHFTNQWRDLNLYSIDFEDATDLKLNTIMTVASARIGTANVIDSAFILLARSPYSTLDRYTTAAVPLTTLSFDRDYLKFFASAGLPTLQVTETAVASVYPPFRVNRFTVEPTIKAALSGVESQVVLDGSVIVGPDV